MRNFPTETVTLLLVDGPDARLLQLAAECGGTLVTNTLWGGRVADETVQDQDTVALRALNAKLRDDPRVALSVRRQQFAPRAPQRRDRNRCSARAASHRDCRRGAG